MPKPEGAHSTGDLHFFDVSREEGRRNYARGTEWYFEHFAGAEDHQRIGEKTADYLADKRACELIKNNLGDIQILIMLRDPVSRAYSHFWHERHNLAKFGSFDEFLDWGKDVGDALVFKSSFYSESIGRYRQLFGEENVKVLVAEEMYARSQAVLADVCRFLQIRDDFVFPLENAQINRGTAETSIQWIRTLASRLSTATPRFYEKLRTSAVADVIKNYVGRRRSTGGKTGNYEDAGPAYPAISPAQIERLRDMYRDDVTATSRILQRDLLEFWWAGQQ